MNIFYLSHDVDTNAKYHVSRHVVKMILEQLQLLSTAHRVLDGKLYIDSSSGRKIKRYKLDSELDSVLYTATHINHPSAIWTRQSAENYLWLANSTKALAKEYTYRYGKVHKCESSGLIGIALNNIPKNIPNKPFTQPTPAMPVEYIVPGDSIQSYRNYYNNGKRHLFNWTNREVPAWIEHE